MPRIRPPRLCALALLSFLPAGDLAAQVISEVMYHPRDESAPGVEDKRYEWVEIYNENADPLDLSDCSFSKGISFTFPPGTFLLGRSYLVVCADESAVRARYGITNTAGNWSGVTALDNSGETIALVNPSGVEMASISYNDRGRWPAGADGTGHSLALLDPFLENDDPDSWALSQALGGSPGAANFGTQSTFQDTVLIADNETWSYFKGTQASPANWTSAAFSDAGWLTGKTGIGYGDSDDATVLDDMQNAYRTIFCRKKFAVADPAAIEKLMLAITYDDGFYAHLNGGTEVTSRNVTGKGFDTDAGPAIEPTYEEIDITAQKGKLVAGSENLLAVQVHNSGIGSSDLSFIPRLISRKVIPPTALATAPVVFNEAFIRTDGERWIELHNTSNATFDLSGFHITDDRRDLVRATLPAGTSIPARGFLAFSDGQLGLNFSLTSPAPRSRVFVALVNPAGTRVIDAYSFKPTIDGLSEARFPDGDEDVASAATPTRAAANQIDVVGEGDIVINEIMYHPISEDPDDEFIELLNRGALPVDLTGFEFSEGVEFAFESVTLDPGATVVVARNPQRIRNDHGLPAGRVLGPWYNQKTDSQGNPVQEPAALKDGGERITLLDPNGNVADTVRYGEGGEWPFWPDGRGSSLELIDPFQDNGAAQAWDASDDSAESVPQAFSYTSRHAGGESELQLLLLDRGISIVDDISVKLGATEHLSNGHFESSATGWAIEGTHVESGRTVDAALVVSGNGSLKLIATGGGDNKVNRIETRPDLSPALNTTSTYTVSFNARWIVGSRALLTRGYNHGLARSHVLEIPGTLGTPGSANSVSVRQIERSGSSNMGPVIDKVSQLPVVPGASQTVTVTARVRDPNGIRAGTVRLRYALNTPPASAASFISVAMADADGDGSYTGTIPGQTNGTRVLFFIEAQDNSAARLPGRYPLDHTQRTHPTLLDPEAPSLGDFRYAIYRHDVELPSTRFHSYRFVMHQANQDYLQNRPVHSNDLVDGTFIFGSDRAYYQSRIRWSGSPWLRGPGNWGNSYRVRFPSDCLLHGRIKSFNLENHGTRGEERISHHLIRYNNAPGVKVPYALQWYARWQVNDLVNSTYEHVPQPDNEYMDRWFPGEDGDFFEMDDRFEFNDSGLRASNQNGRLTFPPYANTIYTPADPADGYARWKENYRYYLNIRSKANQDDYTNLIRFSEVLDAARTNAPTFDANIDKFADLESMLRVWAVRWNTDDWDTWGTSRGKNCYLYRRSSDGLWVLVPWDLELTYNNVNAFPLGSTPAAAIPVNGLFPEVSRLLNRPRIKRRFYGIIKEMLTRQFGSSFLTPWMDALQANGTGNTNIGRSGGFIDQRASLLRTWVNPVTFPVQRLLIQTNSGNPFETQNPTVNLDGVAPAEIYAFVVSINGTPLDPQPDAVLSTTNMTGWSMKDIPLVPGLNRLVVAGYTAQPDDLVDSDTIDITFTGGWDPPTIASIDPAAGPTGATLTLLGSEFHDGLKVFFGTMEATSVIFDETADATRTVVRVPAGLEPGEVMVKVKNRDAQESAGVAFNFVPSFIRGDANLDGFLDLADAVKVLLFLFGGGTTTCSDAIDIDDNAAHDTTDAIFLLEHIFRGGPAPPAPFPGNGLDPTGGDPFGCTRGL